MSPSTVSVSISGIPETQNRLRRYQRPSLSKRIEAGLLLGGRRLVPFIRAATPRGSDPAHPLAASIRAWVSRREPMAVEVGPISPIAHLLIRGTRTHDIAPRRARALQIGDGFAARATVRGLRPNDFPARGAAGHEGLITAAVVEELK